MNEYFENETNNTETQKPVDENPTYRYSSSHIPEEPVKKEKKRGGALGFLKKALLVVVLGIIFGLFAGTGLYVVNLITDHVSFSVSEIHGMPSQGGSDEKLKPEGPSDGTKDGGKDGSKDGGNVQIGALPDDQGHQGKDDDSSLEDIISSQSQTGTVNVMDASGVVEQCMPSIVAITNKYTYTQTLPSFFGPSQQYSGEAEASGSGIIVGENDDELLIVTNSHVISDADELVVQFVDETTASAQIKGSEEDQDLAIIAVKLSDLSQDTQDAIKIATIGDSDALKVGEPAIAIGNALGYGQSVTAGIISAVDRDFTYDNASHKVIQTDAAINPGNSGGALFNINGELIGINEAKYSETSVEGVGYAIPISVAKPVIEELATKTTRTKVDEGESGYLGIGGADVTDNVSQMYGIPVGVYISIVGEGTAAEKAGLLKGDIITEFDGQTVTTMESLKEILTYYPAGETVEMKVQRVGDEGYKEETISVVLGKREQQ